MKTKTVWVRLLVGLAVTTAFLWGVEFGTRWAVHKAVHDAFAPLEESLKDLEEQYREIGDEIEGLKPCDVITSCKDCISLAGRFTVAGRCIGIDRTIETPAGQLPTGVR